MFFSPPLKLCDTREAVIGELFEVGERLRGVGARGYNLGGGWTELWVKDTDDEATWSVIITLFDGTSCLVGSGYNWSFVNATKENELKGDPI